MNPSQNNEIGQALRKAFIDQLELQGTDCEAGGETRQALIQEDKQAGMYILKFADEFDVKKGDKIRNAVTEQMLAVAGWRPVSKSGVFHHFEVGAVAA